MSPRSVVLFLSLVFALGCAGGGADPAQPGLPGESGPRQATPSSSFNSNRYLWGFWKVRIEPDAGSVEVVPMRGAEMHLNAVRLLEVEPCSDCLRISNVAVYPGNELTADLTLKHPFPGYLKLTAFDVRGIFISGADYTFPVSERSIAWSDGLPRMLNADGYTSLFNPTEFPETIPPALGYIKGKYAPGGDLTSTLNPFLAYRADAPRRLFEPGGIDTRTVQLYVPEIPMQFGYAVDASWQLVEDVIDPVEDFPPEANCLEAYRIDTQVGVGEEPDGGSAIPLRVGVFDHQGLGSISTVTIEGPQLFSGEVPLEFLEVTGDDSFMFSGAIPYDESVGSGEYPLLVRVMDVETDENLGIVDAWQVCTVPKKGWARTWGGVIRDRSFGVTADGSGGVYVTGGFRDAVDFDPGPGVDEHSSNSPWEDVYLSKFDSQGDFEWARTWGGYSYEWGHGVAVDNLGGVYVTGFFHDTVDFDPGPGVDEHSSNTGMDAFLSKFDSEGSFQWARTWGGYGLEWGHGVAVDNSGSVYVTGNFMYTVDFDPGPGVDNQSSKGYYDAFLSKFDSEGDYKWARTWGASDDTSGYGVAADGLGSVYVTGNFEYTVDFDPGPGLDEHSSNGSLDVFLSKFDAQGDFEWARTWGGHSGEIGYEIALDSSGGVYVAGCFPETVDFDPGPGVDERSSNGLEDAFLSKFNSEGDLMWVRTWGSASSDRTWGAAVGDSGSVYATGGFMDTVDFDPGPGLDEHSSNGFLDVFLSKFDVQGDFVWVRTWGSTYTDEGLEVAVDGSGNAYIAGTFGATMDFDPGLGIDEHSSNGESDVFLSKFPADGNW